MNNKSVAAFAELERTIHAALETYANVHRGSGHNSVVTTRLFEQAREIVLAHLGLKKGKYVVIFCTPRGGALLTAQLEQGSFQIVSSQDIGLPLGIRALAVKKASLPKSATFYTGGGTTRLIAPGWVIWAEAPDRFEAGTPAIINVIAFARALQLSRESHDRIFAGRAVAQPGNELIEGPAGKQSVNGLYVDQAVELSGQDLIIDPGAGPTGNNLLSDLAAEKLTVNDILYHDELEEYSGLELLDKLRQTHIGRGIQVPTEEGPRSYTNLDNSASTPTFTPVWNAVRQTWRQSEKVQQEIIQEVRSICANMLGALPADYKVIFTSNTTEAINLAAESLGLESQTDPEAVILNTLLEHSSNDLPWRMVPYTSLIRLSIDDDGFVDMKELDTLLCEYNQKGQHGQKRIKLVAVSGASNVLGVFNNLAEISRVVHQYGARLLVDAAQLIAHRKVDMAACGIDYLAFSGHKVYAPFGTGVLVARKGLLNFSPAEQELIRSSGEENPVGIAALGKALVLLQRIGMETIREDEQSLTRRALSGLLQIPGLTVYGIKDPESPSFAHKGGVIVFNLKGIMANKVAKELSSRGGIGVRYGCHCAHLLVKRLVGVGPRLEQFQRVIVTLFPRLNLPGVVRVSIGIENSEEDVDTLIRVLSEIARKH